MEEKKYRWRQKSGQKTYEEMLFDLKRSLERGARVGKYKKRKGKKADGDT
jgi:hypothetical protein